MGQQKKSERDRVLSLKRPPLAKPTQQPTENSTKDKVGILEVIRLRRNIGGGRLQDDSSNEK
jgi:hypothetical protein